MDTIMSKERVFNPKKRKKLNNPVRLQWVPPHRVAELVGLKSGGQYADLGAGTGFLSRAVGELAEPSALHTLDIEPLMITEMEETLGDIKWLTPTLMERDRLPFADGSFDGLWSIAVFHELGDPQPILTEVLRVLKPGGKFLVVDWARKKEACEQGPPFDGRIAESEVKNQLEHAGFVEVSCQDGFLYHFGVTGIKGS